MASIIELLPRVVSEGRAEARRILDGVGGVVRGYHYRPTSWLSLTANRHNRNY